ncbi:uncharacterized protein LOC133823014 [Humulus lupulus]|uniref:uncharacterized protein LOC133823014 n=1 Tax=Humulus lupulus TaxID=3486 RepID=UPI002B40B530|nr:uncharacterized protein LOC133823014 [Humulus lupulus]XP_062111554.1 uncharacterized protein LOC133823014 [Humulus lupulus]
MLEISDLKKSFATEFASVIALLGDIKASMPATNDNGGVECEDHVHANTSSEDYFDDCFSGGYQDVYIGEEMGADFEHFVQIASQFITPANVRARKMGRTTMSWRAWSGVYMFGLLGHHSWGCLKEHVVNVRFCCLGQLYHIFGL